MSEWRERERERKDQRVGRRERETEFFVKSAEFAVTDGSKASHTRCRKDQVTVPRAREREREGTSWSKSECTFLLLPFFCLNFCVSMAFRKREPRERERGRLRVG